MSDQHPLNEWLKLRSLSQAELVEYLEIPNENVVENAYEGLTNVVRLNNSARHPGYFYFRDDVLVMLYVEAFPTSMHSDFTSDRLRQELGEPELELRSRAGKHNRIFVYPQQGIAFSADLSSGGVDFIEVFQPMTADSYRQTIYREPPKFKR